MRVFIDTNFIVNLIVETDLTEKTKNILKEIANSDLVCSVNVVEETVYVYQKAT